jgi:hypothetical protein
MQRPSYRCQANLRRCLSYLSTLGCHFPFSIERFSARMLAAASVARLSRGSSQGRLRSCRGAAKRTQHVSVASTSAIGIGAPHCYWGDHRAGARRRGNGDTLDDVPAGFAEEGKNSSFGGCVRRPTGDFPSPPCHRAPRREYPLLSTFRISRTGGLAARSEPCRIIVDRSQNLRKWEARNAYVVVINVWAAQGRRTNRGTRGAAGPEGENTR